jgi:hypothetical protein
VLLSVTLSCAAMAASGPELLAQPTRASSSTASFDKEEFPLRVRPGERYLEDATGKPFLIHGEAAWSLITQLRREDAETYLEDRRRRGFNAITVNLLEHRFASNAPANAYDDPPFLVPGDFGAPNEAYFAHADWVLRRAAEKGMLALLAPAWLGYQGSSDGWYREMLAAGLRKLRDYGRFLGKRYSAFTNILWMHAGDYNPPQKDLVRAVAQGILEFDRNALHTAHCAPETAALEYWAGEPWLSVNNIYTYKAVWRAALKQYARTERLPFFLIESKYENESGISGPQRMRAQAYHALLSGASGQVFGNNPIWRFDGPPMEPSPISWTEALNSPGTQSMTALREMLTALPWWKLEPDRNGSLLTGGQGSGFERAVAAKAADGSIGLIYLPTARAIQVETRDLGDGNLSTRWYDPAGGTYSTAVASRQSGSTRSYVPQSTNNAGSSDWVLILEAAPRNGTSG